MDSVTIPCSSFNMMHLEAAFLAMEPADCFVSLARQCGGGSITSGVQSFILEHCINNDKQKSTAQNHAYIKNTLKKVIVAVESSNDDVVEGLYEQFAYHITLHVEDDLLLQNNTVYKHISFLFDVGHDEVNSSLKNLVVPLGCSLNMLEGDTGCALWPSSLFLSEFILSYPYIFSNKFCFEVGSGVGLVGITLIHAGSSKVVLTDGDMCTLANLRCNLELNQLNVESELLQRTGANPKSVECKYLPWESASEEELQNYRPNIILGADIIYDPLCVPHLIRVLSILLKPESLSSSKLERKHANGEVTHHTEENGNNILQEAEEAPIAYIATVIRNLETFDYFLRLAGEAHLFICDITEIGKPRNLLSYMLSYDRPSVRLFKVSFSCT